MMSEPARVDARGMRCPWPVLRLARALRDAEQAVLIADDPATAGELALLAAAQGWMVVPQCDNLSQQWHVSRKSPA